MKAFRFPLQRVLEWRNLQMRAEEEKLAGLQHKLADLIRRDSAVTAAQLKSEQDVLGMQSIEGSVLRALAAFQLRVQAERASLKEAQGKCEKHIADQRQRLLKARKDSRVLEKLKEQRLKAWTYLGDREVEETAAESYISKWARSETEG